ncbi:MAG: hypothetical protein ABSG82_04850 [Sedimentisphaerales bacterium]|jgi:hypothetical protein
MNPNEKKLEELMSKMTFDDKPDYRHRDKLEQELLAAFARRQWQQERQSRQTGVWRAIMQNRPMRLVAAAAVIAVVGLSSWAIFHHDVTAPITSMELLAKAQAAEKTLFAKTGIVHLVSEITVYPTTNKGAELIEKLGDTKKSAEEVNKINHEIFSQWLVTWLPISSLKANGWPEMSRIKLSEGAQQAYIIQDESWYDAATGRFARVMETDGNIIFANSYDGSFVYQSESMNNGTIKMKSEAIAANFKAPDNPAEFLGLTAGVQQCLDEKCLRQPVQAVTNDVLTDGTKVTVYKAGFTGVMGEQSNTYYLFKVRQSDEIVAEIEYITNGKPQIIIRRALSESVEKPEFSWNLAEISSKELAAQSPSPVTVASDIAIPNISVRDMAERASFDTYIFATDPNWTQQRMLVDVLDTMSAPKRMFVAIYKAQDKRDVIVAQSETHNKYFASITKQIEAAGKMIPKTIYPNGCKLWENPGPVAWWTDLTLRSSGIEPAANRSGYIIETPSETRLIVAINGQLTKEELDGLINSLIPAKDYQVK